jgi:hypothetical protein
MEHLPTIYAAAVLLPLASFVTILLLARHLERFAAWVATGAILGAGLLSCVALAMWLAHHFPAAGGEHDPHASAGHAEPVMQMRLMPTRPATPLMQRRLPSIAASITRSACSARCGWRSATTSTR